MSFEEKLRTLRVEKIREEELKKARKEEEERIKEETEKRRVTELERLSEIAEEKLFPVFKLTNETYLEGEGEIALEKRRFEHRDDDDIRLTLDWRDIGGVGFKRLLLTLDNNLNVKLKGAAEKSPRVEFSLEDENWQEKMKKGIYAILSEPSACWIPPKEVPDDWSVS